MGSRRAVSQPLTPPLHDFTLLRSLFFRSLQMAHLPPFPITNFISNKTPPSCISAKEQTQPTKTLEPLKFPFSLLIILQKRGNHYCSVGSVVSWLRTPQSRVGWWFFFFFVRKSCCANSSSAGADHGDDCCLLFLTPFGAEEVVEVGAEDGSN